KDVEKRGKRRLPSCDLGGVEQVKPLLQAAEARLAAIVEADDLTIEDGAAGEAVSQGRCDFREELGLRLVIAAEEVQPATIKAAEHAQPVEFRFEEPSGAVEGVGDERAKHQRRFLRHRRGAQAFEQVRGGASGAG